jgi:hypothetical protein
LGLLWFGKLDSDQDRQKKAVILFTHTFESYKKIYNDEQAAQRAGANNSRPRTRPGSSFLNDVCMLRPEDDAPPADAISELTLFWAAYRTYGREDRDKPLSLWKVCLLLSFLLYFKFEAQFQCRSMDTTSQLFRGWPATFWRFPAPASPSSGSSPDRAVYATKLEGL